MLVKATGVFDIEALGTFSNNIIHIKLDMLYVLIFNIYSYKTHFYNNTFIH